jgi:hypothetical protein
VLALIAGMLEISIAIVAVIIVNAVFSFFQEYRAEKRGVRRSILVRVRRSGRDVHSQALDPQAVEHLD